MVTKILVVLLTAILIPLAGVMAQAEKPLTDVKTLAGTWNGWWNNPRSGQAVRSQIIVKEDGSYSFHIPGGASATGTIAITDGKARYQGSVGDPGTVVLVDNKGKEVLKFVRRDGSTASEFER